MDRDHFFPQYVPVRERRTAPEFCVTWVRKVSEFRELPAAVKADPPPLTTGLLFGTSEKELADPYDLVPGWTGQGDKSPDEEEPGWRFRHTALRRECSLCPGVEAYRLLPCCACQHWVHLECSYGTPEGRLCASRCQILDPLRGVVATDYNCRSNEVRCLVPWRPWVKKFKEERWVGSRRHRIMHELLPNLALEKHSLLGAGLMWTRITPWKALPLIPVWDKLSIQTYHTEFGRQHGLHGDQVLTNVNALTSLDMNKVDRRMEYGMLIRPMDHPYLLSPPSVPVAGATRTRIP